MTSESALTHYQTVIDAARERGAMLDKAGRDQGKLQPLKSLL